MPAVPHPCFDPLGFYLDTGDSKVHHRLKAGGGIILDADGLSVGFPDGPSDVTYSVHTGRWSGNAAITGDLSGVGLVTPGDGPVTGVMDVGPAISNPWPSNADIYMTVRADLMMVGSGESAGNGRFSATVSPDGVIGYEIGQYSQFMATGGGAFSAQGYNGWAGAIPFTVPPGWSGTPKCVLGYDDFGATPAGLIRCTLVSCWISMHRA